MNKKLRYLKVWLPPPTPRPKDAAKHFDRLAIIGGTQANAKHMAGLEHRPLRHRRLPSIAPTRRQMDAIRACLEATDEEITGRGILPARISPSQIHLVRGKIFDEIAGASDWKGFTYRDHAYLRAKSCRSRVDLIANLTHELAHLVSYRVAIYDGRRKRPRYVGFVAGLNAQMFNLGMTDRPYDALNEATTELLAHQIRHIVADKLGLSEFERRRLLDYVTRGSGYGRFTEIMLVLLAKSAKDKVNVIHTLITSALHGTDDFQKMLHERGRCLEFFGLAATHEALSSFVKRFQ